MKVVVCIGNNLIYDTRVKRHVCAIAKRGHLVHVAACPVPDGRFAMAGPNITYSMSKYTPGEHPVNGPIMEFAREFGLEEAFLESFPILESQAYYYEPELEKYTRYLDVSVSGQRWTDITSRCSEPMTYEQALCYPLCFFERAVQYAKDVLEHPADVILCNDEDTLLAGVVHKMKYHSRLIYDFHDIAADMTDGLFPQMYSNVLALFEKKMISYADAVMSVSKSSLIWSKQHYGYRSPAVYMPNCSAYSLTRDEACKQRTAEGSIRIYYHGMCDRARGLAELMEAIGRSGHFSLVLRCLPSDYLEELRRKASSMGLGSRVVFLEPVPPEQILSSAARDGDVGFAFCQTGKCLNWRFALQNKFIEYAKAGLPMITSDTAEQGAIVRKYRCGWILRENTTDGIEDVLQEIWRDRKHLAKMSKRAWKCSGKSFDWNLYEKVLQGLVENKESVSRYFIKCKLDEEKLCLWEQEDVRNFNKGAVDDEKY